MLDKTGKTFILDTFNREWSEKFDKGIEEHGAGFMDIPTIEHAWEEALDQVSYIAKARDDRNKAIFFLETALHSRDWDLVLNGYNIVKYGNPQGRTVVRA